MATKETINTLIKEYEESEVQLVRTKKLYDQLQQLALEERERERKQEMGALSVKKVSSDGSSNLLVTISKSSTKSLKDTKSSSSLSSTKSSNLEAKSISKSVEKRIHHLENYKNILRQSKAPPEKQAFLDLLNK